MKISTKHKQAYEYGKGWINTKYFTEVADYFTKHGYYTDAPEGTREYFQFWDREHDRILNGMCVGSMCITGSHYFYLNYTRIRKSGKKGRKQVGFPDFWDGDYDFFWNWEIVRYGYDKDVELLQLFNKPLWLDGGHHMLLVKARQKGCSCKAAAIATREYNFFKASNTFIGAYLEDYANANFAKVMNNIHHINEYTAFIKRRQVIDRQDYIRASYLERDEEKGVDIEKGYKSEIIVKSFHENKNATRGGSYDLVIIEEAGSFGPPGTLKQVISSTRDTLEEGAFTTGNMLVFGTSGEMDKGSIDLSEIAYSPDVYNFMPYEPVWDDPNDHETKTVYFFPAHLCLPGYIDDKGNSDLEGAKAHEEARRKKFKDAGKIVDLIAYKAERPMKLSEAFDIKSGSYFSSITEIKIRLDYLKYSKVYEKVGTPVELYYDGDAVKVMETDKDKVIWEFKHYKDNREGAVVIYEMPEDPLARYQYIIAYDPYRHDHGSSLGAAYVYKTSKVYTNTHDTIVASYIARPQSFAKYNDTLIKLAELYNAKILYENEVPAVKTYFQQKKKLHLLEFQPDDAIKSILPYSSVSRVYGVHMTDKLKYTAEQYLDEWLLEVRATDSEGNVIRNIDMIYDIGLLQELVRYNRKINVDRVSAMFVLMLYLTQINIEQSHRKYRDDDYDPQNALMEYMKKFVK